MCGRTRVDKVLLFSDPRLNGMLVSPRRPTIEKMTSRKFSPLHIAHRRMVVSMPNLQDIAVPELPARNASLRKVDTAGCGSSSIGDNRPRPRPHVAPATSESLNAPGSVSAQGKAGFVFVFAV